VIEVLDWETRELVDNKKLTVTAAQVTTEEAKDKAKVVDEKLKKFNEEAAVKIKDFKDKADA